MQGDTRFATVLNWMSFQSTYHSIILWFLYLIGIMLQVGDESFESFSAEKDGILKSLARRAKVRQDETGS